MSQSQETIEQLIYQETEKRLEIMQDKKYQFPGRINAYDILTIITSVIVCIILIVCCARGVIE